MEKLERRCGMEHDAAAGLVPGRRCTETTVAAMEIEVTATAAAILLVEEFS